MKSHRDYFSRITRAKEAFNLIINTGQRTDIPAFYAEWFANRLKEGLVCVRNPYNPSQVSRYRLDPSVVDVIGFCTKNPAPMFPYMELLKAYGQYWFVSITPYGKDIEQNVPDKHLLIEHFKHLSMQLGVNSIGWRYDPIFLSERYSKDYHLKAFEQIATALEGYTKTVVISFVDLYPKVKRNFPELRMLGKEDRLLLGKVMIAIARSHGMTAACACYLSCDIGAYNSCKHLCKYCYANAEPSIVMKQIRLHDPKSPFLIGNYEKNDSIHDVPQQSWVDGQMSLF